MGRSELPLSAILVITTPTASYENTQVTEHTSPASKSRHGERFHPLEMMTEGTKQPLFSPPLPYTIIWLSGHNLHLSLPVNFQRGKELHSGREGSNARTPFPSLCGTVTHTAILEGECRSWRISSHPIAAEGKTSAKAASLMSLHSALWSIIAWLGHFLRTCSQIQEEHLFRHHQRGNNVHFQTCRRWEFNPTVYKDAALLTANLSLRDWTSAFVLFRYTDPYPPNWFSLIL